MFLDYNLDISAEHYIVNRLYFFHKGLELIRII